MRDHVTFDVVYDVVTPQTKRAYCRVTFTAIANAFVWLIPYAWDYLEFLTRRKSPALWIHMYWI